MEKVNLLFFLTPRILTNYQGQQDSARNTRNLINRRASHLKTSDKQDPFAHTAKGIYDKTKKQEEGPLYNLEEQQRYQQENDSSGIGGTLDEEEMENEEALPLSDPDQTHLEVPNYKGILEQVKQMKSAQN